MNHFKKSMNPARHVDIPRREKRPDFRLALRLALFVGVSYLVVSATMSFAATITASLQPSFQANLTNSLIPQIAANGSKTPTFTRATTATFTDFEGLVRTVLSGEARFQGARRVQNLALNTENLTGAGGWTLSNATAVGGVTDPLGGTAASTLTATAGNGQIYRAVTAVGTTNVTSIWIRRRTGSGTVRLYGPNGASINDITSSLTTSWKRFSATGAPGPSGYVSNVLLVTSGDAVDIAFPQLEDVTGQSNQNPSEYVSNGVLPAPYHGAGVDGVQYFKTLNGNTVASNVVTEATGALITSTQPAAAGGVTAGVVDAGGPLGYLAEGARTNLALYSDQFDNAAWSTGVVTVTADQTAFVTGAVTAEKLFATTYPYTITNTTPLAVSASTAYTYSVFVKGGVGSNIQMRMSDNVTGQVIANFNPLTGVAGSVTAGPFTSVSSAVVPYPNGWYRFSITGTEPAGQSQMVVGFYLINSGDYIYAGGAQVETGSFASSYIPTTSAAVTKNADVLTYPSAGNIVSTQGSLAYEIYPNETAAQMGIPFAMNGFSGYIAPVSAGTLMRFFDGFYNNDWTAAPAQNTLSKWALSWGSAATHMYKDGAKLSPASNALYASFAIGTNLDIGYVHGLADTQLYGTIRNVKIWKKALTDSQLTTLTSTSYNTSRAAVPATTVKAPTKTGLVGAWTFNEGTGTKAADSSGLGNTGTLSGSTLPTWVSGKLGKALSFNGSSGYVLKSAASFAEKPGTISLWFKANSIITEGAQSYQKMTLVQYGDIYWGLQISSATNKIQYHYYDGSVQDWSSTDAITTGRWYNLVVVSTASGSQMYLNGVSEGTSALTLFNNTCGSACNFTVSGSIAGFLPTNGTFDGTIDDVRIYNRALSAAEVSALYKSTATVVNASTNNALTSGLVGLWSFDGKDMNWGTNTAYDRSGNGNNGSLTSMSTSTSPVVGKIGQALKFNGSNGIGVADNASLNFGTGPFSVSFWVKATTLAQDTNIIGKGAAGNAASPGFTVPWRSSGKMGFYVADSSGVGLVQTNAAVVTANAWYHIVVVTDRATSQIYVNGLSQSVTGTPASGSVNNTNQLLFASDTGAWGGGVFKGVLDDVRIYNRALSSTEVRQLYNLGK